MTGEELNDFHPKKSLGQHFLIDNNVLNKIIAVANLEKDDTVIEIGAGTGNLSRLLAPRVKNLILIEKDFRLYLELKESELGKLPNVTIFNEDILEKPFNYYIKGLQSTQDIELKIVANLPYNISSQVIFKIIEEKEAILSALIMIQRELGKRIAAVSGRDSGAISIFLQIFFSVKELFNVHPKSFFPKPKVESTVIRLKKREEPLINVENFDWFKKIVKASFAYRRKTLVNSLQIGLGITKDIAIKILQKMGKDEKIRSENLTIEEFKILAEEIKE